MPDPMNLDEILKRNKRVNREHFEEATRVHKELGNRGLPRKGYDLSPPYERRRTVVGDHRRGELGLSRDASDD